MDEYIATHMPEDFNSLEGVNYIANNPRWKIVVEKAKDVIRVWNEPDIP